MSSLKHYVAVWQVTPKTIRGTIKGEKNVFFFNMRHKKCKNRVLTKCCKDSKTDFKIKIYLWFMIYEIHILT